MRRGRRLAGAAGHSPVRPACYVEDSGTSMAAPHVSGAIAAFLSIRQEFVGQPEQVKDIFTRRRRRWAGSGTSRGTGSST